MPCEEKRFIVYTSRRETHFASKAVEGIPDLISSSASM
jgi:hypothetical protein